MIRNLMILITGMVALAGLQEAVAQSQILIIDNARVENEAAAYKDFALQTTTIRENILTLRQYFNRGGTLEQEVAKLEQQKAIIGNEAFEQKRSELEKQAQTLQQQFQILELQFDRLRQKAIVQVERARQPIYRELINKYNAQVILPKRSVLGHASGIDVTTEFIESLDGVLAQVSLPELTQASANNNNADSADGIEEID